MQKKSSRFIYLRCLKQNCVGQGIQRPNTKEVDHIKNLSCLCVHIKYKTKISKLDGVMIIKSEWK